MKINSKKYFIKTKLRLCILILMIIGIIVYNILLQKRVINFNETIYPIIGIYISLLCLWGVLELNIKFPISYDINNDTHTHVHISFRSKTGPQYQHFRSLQRVRTIFPSESWINDIYTPRDCLTIPLNDRLSFKSKQDAQYIFH